MSRYHEDVMVIGGASTPATTAALGTAALYVL